MTGSTIQPPDAAELIADSRDPLPAEQGASPGAKCAGKPAHAGGCAVLKLVGKQLAAAKTALATADCRLRKVTTKNCLGRLAACSRRSENPHETPR